MTLVNLESVGNVIDENGNILASTAANSCSGGDGINRSTRTAPRSSLCMGASSMNADANDEGMSGQKYFFWAGGDSFPPSLEVALYSRVLRV